jgi:hypothetical protein
MTCADARNIILSADHVALRDRTDPVLRQHLEGCAECAAAASHVVGDVARLRAALIARGARAVPVRPRRSTTKRVAMTVVPVALAAELAFFAFLGNRDNPNELLDRRPVIDDTVTSMLPASHTRIDTGEVALAPAPMPKKARVKAAVQVATVKDSAKDAADSTNGLTAPSEFVSADEMARLEVRPVSRRQRVAVIGTPNPKIHVVWLTKVDSL